MITRRQAISIIPAASVRLKPQPVLVTDQVPEAQSAVELLRSGDRVTSLKIQCACGRVIVAACEYAEAP